jgi:hypothetical protein
MVARSAAAVLEPYGLRLAMIALGILPRSIAFRGGSYELC